MYKEYSYSPITKSSVKILVPWISNRQSKLYSTYKTLHTGLDIQTHDVYGFQSGVVTQIGKDEDGHSVVTVQYSGHVSLRYGHLMDVYVKSGETLFVGSFIGVAYKYLHFEYVTTESSIWPVRIGTITYYKHDPEPLLSGDIILNANDWSHVHQVNYYYDAAYPLTGAMADEFSNNRNGD